MFQEVNLQRNNLEELDFQAHGFLSYFLRRLEVFFEEYFFSWKRLSTELRHKEIQETSGESKGVID